MLRRWWWLVVASIVIGGGLAYWLSSQGPATYRSTTTLLVQQQQTPGVFQPADFQTSQLLANTFARLITLRPVLEEAIEAGRLDLSPQQLERRLEVTPELDSTLLEITASASNAEGAAHIANTVAQTFVNSTQPVLQISTGTVSVVEPALVPGAPEASPVMLNTILGAVLAAIGGVALILIFESLDSRLRRAGDVATLVGLPALGRVHRFRGDRHNGGGVLADPQSDVTEDYRALRTTLSTRLGLSQGSKALLIASPAPGDGKTATTANLATVFGLAGRHVVIVDADLRAPEMHDVFGLRNAAGLTTYLNRPDVDVEAVVQRTSQPNVWVIPAGPTVPNPSELLGSDRMHELLDALREQYDVVLLDSTPLLAVTDATVVAAITDASVMVVRPSKTRREELTAALDELDEAGRPVLGVVLNQIGRQEAARLYSRPSGTVTDRLPETLPQPRVGREI